jgi:hypothetical protein
MLLQGFLEDMPAIRATSGDGGVSPPGIQPFAKAERLGHN